MEPVEPRLSTKKSVVFMIAGLMVFVLYLHFFVGFSEILEIIARVNPVTYLSYYSLTVAAIVLSVLFYSMVWRELLKALSIDIGLKRCFVYCWLGNFVDLVVPLEAVSGEITRAYLIRNDVKGDFGKTLASLVCHRIISIFTTLSILILSSFYLILSYNLEPVVLFLLIGVSAGTTGTIILMLYLSLKEEAAENLVNLLIRLAAIVTRNRLNLSDLRIQAKQSLSVFHEAVKAFGRNPSQLVKPVVYSYVSWFLHLTIYFLVFYALGFTAVAGYVFQVMIVFSVTLAVQTIPIALPVGLVEIVMTSLYVLFGIEKSIGGTATSLIRVVTFWFQILVGYVLVQLVGITRIAERGSVPRAVSHGLRS